MITGTINEIKKKILIVDDEPDLLEVLERRFKANGYDVRLARHGQEALAQIRQQTPDLIVLDVLMPVMDGFSFYKEIKKDPVIATVPVIVLTARNKMEDTFSSIGVDAFIAKPFDASAILAKAEDLIAQARSRVNLSSPENDSFPEPEEETPQKKRSWIARYGIYFIIGFFIVVILSVIFGLYYLTIHASPGKDPFSG